MAARAVEHNTQPEATTSEPPAPAKPLLFYAATVLLGTLQLAALATWVALHLLEFSVLGLVKHAPAFAAAVAVSCRGAVTKSNQHAISPSRG